MKNLVNHPTVTLCCPHLHHNFFFLLHGIMDEHSQPMQMSIRLSYTVRTSRMEMPDAFDLLSTEQAERLACRSCGQPTILLLPSSLPYSNKNGNIQSDDSERRIKRVLRLPSGHFADEEMTDYLQCWSGESAVDFRGSNLFSDFGEFLVF